MERTATCESTIDDALIQACRQGDRQAFRRLFDLCQERVYTIALHTLNGDAAGAEDITQEVFVRLMTRLHQFRGEADFRTWLHRMVVNACLDELRRRRRLVTGHIEPDSFQDGLRTAMENLLRGDAASAVRAALAALSPPLRVTILLKHFEDLSYEEMAAVLGCTKGTVASRLNRGHRALANKLAHLRESADPGDE